MFFTIYEMKHKFIMILLPISKFYIVKVIYWNSFPIFQDLYRTLPILRNSLSCTVCESLLVEPYTPEDTDCEHHVCKGCKGREPCIKKFIYTRMGDQYQFSTPLGYNQASSSLTIKGCQLKRVYLLITNIKWYGIHI